MTRVTAGGFAEPFTAAEVAAPPKHDGRRYELVDGSLLVLLGGLMFALHEVLPPDIALVPDAAYRASMTTQFIPDLFACRRDDATGMFLTAAPLLVVEVASPSTASIDRGRKRDAYEARGVPSYWLADPRVPSVTVLELRDGRYDEVVTVTGDEKVVVERPFRVRLVPSELAKG